jgi:protein arginine kinase activator
MAQKPEEDEENISEKLPDRPLECSECKKPIEVHYTEIVGDCMNQTCMCADCPELHKRLYGISQWELEVESLGGTGLACGNCGTTLDAVRMGHDLGCCDCYTVFEDVLVQELLSSKKIPPRLAHNKKTTPMHLGRSPGEAQEINISMRLLALNEALSETLKKEDYEQAAWLRDQIKALTNKQEEQHDK